MYSWYCFLSSPVFNFFSQMYEFLYPIQFSVLFTIYKGILDTFSQKVKVK